MKNRKKLALNKTTVMALTQTTESLSDTTSLSCTGPDCNGGKTTVDTCFLCSVTCSPVCSLAGGCI